MNYGTLPSKFLHAMDTWPNPRAQMYLTPAGWQNISSDEFLRRTAGLAQALFELGVKPGDRVGLLAANRPEAGLLRFLCISRSRRNAWRTS